MLWGPVPRTASIPLLAAVAVLFSSPLAISLFGGDMLCTQLLLSPLLSMVGSTGTLRLDTRADRTRAGVSFSSVIPPSALTNELACNGVLECLLSPQAELLGDCWPGRVLLRLCKVLLGDGTNRVLNCLASHASVAFWVTSVLILPLLLLDNLKFCLPKVLDSPESSSI